ncbi:uncharacterized protein N7459_009619 [Penicillium hispanicum]|uniref:uncharacterized protein n=1 Tax=Penicillium hispanicum TaxID=1080232 RepID=UPI00253FA2FF|nr:uncharacterized protein N7459_009619 [Penicillium hispanicum]KAJ5570189.1 hypothetical protein N7459_009619 [Penicillium hispanicum]
MSSYFSSLTSSSSISNVIGSRLNSLRRAVTLGDEGDDPENEDCSHVSNALRAYYTEKGRPFPPWLPPDPKAPAAPTRVVATTQLPSAGTPGQTPATGSYGRGGGLGDLWGDSDASPQRNMAATTSLRRGRGGNAPPLSSTHSAPPPGPVSSPPPPLTHAQSHSPATSGSLQPAGARPLPSQRNGSYQSSQSTRSTQDRGGSAQERLRARLQGGRSPSPNVDPSIRKPVGSTGRPW